MALRELLGDNRPFIFDDELLDRYQIAMTGFMNSLGELSLISVKEHGAQIFCNAVTNELPDLHEALHSLPPDSAGIRISGLSSLYPFLNTKGSVGSLAAGLIGPSARAVRAILFDKTTKTNWSLAWHQDRTICVKRKVDVEGFGPWTIKGGLQHVAPPMGILSRMVTLRVHLDDVPATNAPLLIAPGSHLEGRVAETAISGLVERLGIISCLAMAGDVWAYATPILHASEAAMRPMRRRVLQIDYSPDCLPDCFEWFGV